MPSPPHSVHSGDRSDALFQVRLLAALRSGEPAALHPFLVEIGKAKSVKGLDSDDWASSNSADLAALTLNLAIRCASYETIVILLGHRSISPNAPYPADSHVSPLHLAASLGRADVVGLLLEQDEIDSCAKDAQGRTVLDVATKESKDMILEWRDALQSQYMALLRSYISSTRTDPPPPALLTLLNTPRVHSIDLSALDDQSGTTLLHEAARRNDLRLIELAVRAGADVFVRDRKGRGVGETDKGTVSSKEHERVKVFLRQFTNRDPTLIDDSTATEPPTMKGYLSKYTNVAKGYNTRWFVLRDGVLSYYRHQDDENLAGRGSISMRTAKLKVSTSDRLRFEVSTTGGRSGSNTQKWYMRAEHPVEVARWTQAITRSIEWCNKSPSVTPSVLPSTSTQRTSMQMSQSMSDAGSIKGYSSDNRSIYSTSWKTTSGTASPRKIPRRRTLLSQQHKGHDKSPSRESVETADESGMDGRTTLVNDDSGSISESMRSGAPDGVPPYQAKFSLQENAIQMQVELTTQLLASLATPPNPSPTSSPAPSRPTTATTRANEIKSALQSSLDLLRSMYSEYSTMAKEREEWWSRRFEREQQKNAMWEDSLGLVVGESEGLEKEMLRLREERKTMKRALRASMIMMPDGEGDNEKTVRATKPKPDRALPSAPEVIASHQASKPPAVVVSAPPPEFGGMPTPTSSRIMPPSEAAEVMAKAVAEEDSDDEDDVDEFFDAIDNNTVPNLVVTSPLLSPPPPEETVHQLISMEQYAGYAHPRERLPISNDNRPPVSLWAVLKGSIGKDLTKISFPVFFNEPTSMLQRMAEDMEFTECLDAAAREPDSQRRIAFVAAFAMSNYSSTIGRIAKPFNPMLGETFEYVRVDRQYRYVSEQVSHHPPISACWAESPTWNYYGEVDAKNKFMGKSFEIRPTGVAHADLKIPADFVEGTPHASKYSKISNKIAQGKVLEHYSWKKVTTNVSGFIVGSPTIDHYGDMTVVNHRTGDRCVLSFKPRGWRATTACEIKGYVMDGDGRVTWEIAGRWSSQLVARRAGSGTGDLLPDVSLRGKGGPGSPDGQPECMLLWRNTEKPHMPFNLTPFAITLNDCPPDTLKPYLPPTDCRLRPDQRAFENGEYERANGLKTDLEEFQRATRRKREAGQLPQHKPKWFEATTDADTGERVWAPHRSGDMLDYWSMRERIWKSGGKETWDGVERIFGDIQ